MPKLTALDLPGSAEFVHALQKVWERGDAVFPLDRRLPTAAQESLLQRFGAASIITGEGETVLGVGTPVEPGDALVIATSGSSGPPKGAVLTHSAIEASARATSARLEVSVNDHWLACLPLAHIGGLSVITRSLIMGTALTVIDGFDADLVDKSEATLVSLVSTALQRIDATRFRYIVLGGARPPADRVALGVDGRRSRRQALRGPARGGPAAPAGAHPRRGAQPPGEAGRGDRKSTR